MQNGANQITKSKHTNLLQKVSRTFALTIPLLPRNLEITVTNAYLLCRIADTIEDDPGLSFNEKREFSRLFLGVLEGRIRPEDFVQKVEPKLSESVTVHEQELIRETAGIVEINQTFPEPERQAILRCVRTMSAGMIDFQQSASKEGLATMQELDRYCYHVAGVVGEMLTELFCLHSPEIAKNRDELMNLAVSFGQGLQMTNILKDLWNDYHQDSCWLPRSVFEKSGFNLLDLPKSPQNENFRSGLNELVGITNGHLNNAKEYTLLIPKSETGIRKFCFWIILMAVLTLRKIHKNRSFTDRNEVKISRNSVKLSYLATHLSVKNNFMLNSLFSLIAAGLPVPFHSGQVKPQRRGGR